MWRRLCVVLACTADAVHGGTGHKGQADVIEREKATNEAMKMLNMASNSVNQLVLVKVEETEMTDGKYHITLVTGISSCTKSDEILSIVQCPLESNAEEQTWALVLKPVNGEYDVLDMHQVANPGPDAANGHIKAGGVQDIPLGSNDAELDKVVEYAVGQYRALHGANGFKGHPRIIKAQRQVVAGIKYIVTLEDDQGITFQLVAVSQPWITDDPIHVEQFEPQAPNARVQLLRAEAPSSYIQRSGMYTLVAAATALVVGLAYLAVHVRRGSGWAYRKVPVVAPPPMADSDEE